MLCVVCCVLCVDCDFNYDLFTLCLFNRILFVYRCIIYSFIVLGFSIFIAVASKFGLWVYFAELTQIPELDGEE